MLRFLHTHQVAAACTVLMMALVAALATQAQDPSAAPLDIDAVLAVLRAHEHHESFDLRRTLVELMLADPAPAQALGLPPDEVRAVLHAELCARTTHPSNQIMPLCPSDAAEHTPVQLPETDTVNGLNPVLLVPGLMGTRLNGTWDKVHKPAFYCSRRETSWFVLWFNLEELLVPKCLFDTLHLVYDETQQTFVPPAGINVLPAPGLDAVEHIVYVRSKSTDLMTYLLSMQKHLVSAGYSKQSIGAFGYDWRLGTDWDLSENGQAAAFQRQVQALSESNGNRPVYIVTHSMGGVTATAFLNRMSPRWRAKYVAGFVPIALPLYGASKAVLAAISGDGTGLQIGPIHLLPRKMLAHMSRTCPGNLELAPSRDFAVDGVSLPIVQSPARNYSAADLPSMWETTLHAPTVTAAARTVSQFLPSLQPPQVPVHCMHGRGVDTVISIRYGKDDLSDSPHQIMGDGDGTVPLSSLTGCLEWATGQRQPVTNYVYPGRTHLDIVTDKAVLADVVAIVTRKTQDQS